MSDQEQTRPSTDTDEAVAEAPQPAAKDSALADDLDDILDEIDEVLETNAEEFVKSYVQKGGQ